MNPARRRATLRALPRWLPKHLTHKASHDRRDTRSELRRRRQVVAGVSVVGAGLLGVSLATPPGSRRFYPLTLGLAATWTAGALASGPLRRGWIEARHDRARRPVAVPVLTGVAAFGAFYGCARVARRVPVLNDAVARALLFADRGSPPLVLVTVCANGVAEELFFRGALYSAAGRRPVLTSTLAYTAATTATRNPALVLASAAMGVLFGLQRRSSGGVQEPALTHLTWSVLMMRYLPPLFRERDAP